MKLYTPHTRTSVKGIGRVKTSMKSLRMPSTKSVKFSVKTPKISKGVKVKI